MRTRARLAAVLAALALPAVAALGFYLAGNGVTAPALALATVPAGLLAAAAWALGRRPRAARATLVALLALDGAFVAWRCERTAPERASLQLCEMGDCGGSPPLLARVAPEGETVRAGMALCGALGLIVDPERSGLQRLIEREYGAIERTPGLAALPSAPLLGLVRGEGRALLWQPPGRNRVPAVIFLHGFGGQLTAYLKALIDGGLGEPYALLAPLGGPAGRWWTDHEQERLLRLLDRGLPPSVDPSRLYLVGLSNGAIGATAIASSPRFAGRFRRVVALSGSGPLEDAAPTTPPTLFLTGRDDPRFPLAYIEQAHGRLRDRGVTAALAAIDGDHFILLSRKHEVARRIREWFDQDAPAAAAPAPGPSASAASAPARPPGASIGEATMRPDRTIEMRLRAETADGTVGDALFTYPPNHPQHRAVLDHVGGLRPGQSKPVPPWD